MSNPIEKATQVPLAPEQAFALFTAGIDSWWPKETHSLSAGTDAPARKVAIEPRLGGLIIEYLANGDTAPWATITDWQPGEYLAFDWYVGRNPDEATKVSVRFTPEGNGTRVDLRHWGFEVLGPEAEKIEASYRGGWDIVLGQCYGGAARKAG